MSEFIAEAQVLILPNTAAFAATLRKQLEAAVVAAGPITVPVLAAPATGAAVSTAATLVAAQEEATAATLGLSAATGLEAQALDLAAKAQLDSAAAAGVAGAAAVKEAAELEALITAQNAADIAFRKSEAVALASVGATTELAAARATLRAATVATVANEVAFDAALATTSAVQKNAAADALAEARALQVNAQAAFESAVAHNVNAAATGRAAAVHAQAARGLAAETLALGGLRGATLAASAPFLIGATATILFAKSIKEASNETEALNKVQEVFGKNSEQIEKFSKSTATSLGISTTAALEAAGVFGNLFRSLQFGEKPAADMSQRLVELSSDLASFNNADPTRVLEALRSGLVGQARPLRVFGIFISQARAQQEALIETQKKSVKNLTNAEVVQARYNIILKDSAIAQGDFERTQGRLANQSRILSANLSNTEAAIGHGLLPVLERGAHDLNQFFRATGLVAKGIKNLGEEVKTPSDRVNDFGKQLATTAGRVVLFSSFEIAGRFMDHFAGSVDRSTIAITNLNHAMVGGAKAAHEAVAAFNAAQRAINQIGSGLRGLEVQRLEVQTKLAPGGRGAEEANLRKQIALDKKAVAAAQSGTKARRERLAELKADQDDLARLLEEDAQDAQDRAGRIEDAARAQAQAAQDAAQAQQDATQAFIESFSGRRGRLDQRLTSAQLFGTAKTQIALNKLIIAADKAEIEAIRDRIRHLKLHGEALKLAKSTIEALNQEIFNTRNAILQLQSERKQALADARQSHLEAQLSIAETTASTRDDISAEKALIKFDQAQIRRILAIKRRRRLTQEEVAQLDAYRVDLAQRKEALKKTKDEVEDTGKKLKELAFSFLQQQQGFAANLLGNLIPGFATGGLVGGASAASATGGFGQPGGPQPGGGVIPGMDVSGQAALASSRERGVRPVQVDTTNHLLRQILAAVTGKRVPPEIVYNSLTAGAAMDGPGV